MCYNTGGGRLVDQHKFYSYRVRAPYFLTNINWLPLLCVACMDPLSHRLVIITHRTASCILGCGLDLAELRKQ